MVSQRRQLVQRGDVARLAEEIRQLLGDRRADADDAAEVAARASEPICTAASICARQLAKLP